MNDENKRLEEDKLPTPEEWERLLREWRDDTSQRVLRDKDVQYENEYDRYIDAMIERGKFRQQAPDKDRER